MLAGDHSHGTTIPLCLGFAMGPTSGYHPLVTERGMTDDGKGLNRFPTPHPAWAQRDQGREACPGAVAFVRGTSPTSSNLQGESSPAPPTPSRSLRAGGQIGEEQAGEWI